MAPKHSTGMSEGVITYNIRFPEVDPNSVMASMLPDQVKTYFKESKVRTEMNFGFGMVKTVGISDSKTKSATIMLNLFGKNYATRDGGKDILAEGKIDYKFEFRDEIKRIAGYDCKQIIVTNKHNNTTFPIYYTEALAVQNLYWNTPFREINGALFQFPIIANQLQMELTAVEVKSLEVADSLFTVPESYKIISRQEFNAMIAELMEAGS